VLVGHFCEGHPTGLGAARKADAVICPLILITLLTLMILKALIMLSCATTHKQNTPHQGLSGDDRPVRFSSTKGGFVSVSPRFTTIPSSPCSITIPSSAKSIRGTSLDPCVGAQEGKLGAAEAKQAAAEAQRGREAAQQASTVHLLITHEPK
jgi:hypothetical protein